MDRSTGRRSGDSATRCIHAIVGDWQLEWAKTWLMDAYQLITSGISLLAIFIAMRKSRSERQLSLRMADMERRHAFEIQHQRHEHDKALELFKHQLAAVANQGNALELRVELIERLSQMAFLCSQSAAVMLTEDNSPYDLHQHYAEKVVPCLDRIEGLSVALGLNDPVYKDGLKKLEGAANVWWGHLWSAQSNQRHNPDGAKDDLFWDHYHKATPQSIEINSLVNGLIGPAS